MPTIKFEVAGVPQGKGRPKFCSRGKFVTAYTPKKTKEYELMIRGAYLQYLMETGDNANRIGSKAFCMDVIAGFNVPASLSKKKQHELLCHESHTKKPDIDNIIKVVADALNGVAYNDDSQMVQVIGVKQYTSNPTSLIIVMSWEEEDPF